MCAMSCSTSLGCRCNTELFELLNGFCCVFLGEVTLLILHYYIAIISFEVKV